MKTTKEFLVASVTHNEGRIVFLLRRYSGTLKLISQSIDRSGEVESELVAQISGVQLDTLLGGIHELHDANVTNYVDA